MKYLVPFQILRHWVQKFARPHDTQIDMPYTQYVGLIRRLLEPVPVDEAWYRAAYPGIAAAIERGHFRSSLHHYLAHGYFENRSPFAPDRSDLHHPVAYADIRASTPVRARRDGLHVILSWDELLVIVQRLLHAVPVDEDWYRKTYANADEAVMSGRFSSAKTHFALQGYQDGNWPFPMLVDERWYLGRYPDVAKAVSARGVASGQDHFWRAGYREGRFPTRSPYPEAESGHAAAA